MLMELYDEQEVLRSYVESERYEAENIIKIGTAKRFLRMGRLSIEEIAEGTGLTVEEVEELQKELLQPVQRLDCDLDGEMGKLKNQGGNGFLHFDTDR